MKNISFLVLCASLITGSYSLIVLPFGNGAEEIPPPEEILAPEPVALLEGKNLILAAYRDEEFREDVLAFFGNITGSREIAEVILSNSSVYNVPPALAFSLCAEESAFNPRAVNRNKNETIDRGLFQLNSSSFPKLTMDEFFDPWENARYGISHLRWCLDAAGNEVSGLAMYNAGATRVRSAGTPKHTLDYVHRIFKRQDTIEDQFKAEYIRMVEERSAKVELAVEKKRTRFNLSLLNPLGRK